MSKNKATKAKTQAPAMQGVEQPRYYVGLDVALKKTQVCILDGKGKVVVERAINSRPKAIAELLRHYCASDIERIGLESGNWSGWLYQELKKMDLPVVCLDALQTSKFLSVRRNKTDENDARGIAELVRHGMDWVNAAFVKSATCYEIRGLLTVRGRMVKQRVDNELMLRGILKAYGGVIETAGNSEAFREQVIHVLVDILVRDGIDLRPRLVPVLDLIDHLRSSADRIEEELRVMAESHPVCSRFMEIPGVGPIVALSFYTAIEDPKRFKRSEDVGAYLGLTPRIYQSGDTEVAGQITKMGSQLTRQHLVQAANVILSSSKSWSSLKAWGVKMVKKNGYNKAKVAVARKLATIMFAMWRDNKPWYFNQEALKMSMA